MINRRRPATRMDTGARDAFAAHIHELRRLFDAALDVCGFDAVLIGAGLPPGVFGDDQDYPYRPEARFQQWAPLGKHPGSALLYRPGRKPQLLIYEPDDFWHQAAPVPDGSWQREFVLRRIADRSRVPRAVPRSIRRLALLGDPAQWRKLKLRGRVNPPALLTRLDYARAYKTPWEVACLREASARALLGHEAVRQGFADGLSEYELGLLFVAATGQADDELPYRAIIAQNRNGATLHYQHRLRARPKPRQRLSLLVDAGCNHLGYASDITRTHAARRGEFADMVRDAHAAQLRLCDRVKPGVRFPDLAMQAHLEVAGLLRRWGIVRLAPDAAVEARITDHFLPHGLGHLLGLLVHDVGGHLATPRGGSLPPPRRFPRMRFTRVLEPGMVVTIEPGIYFIDSLLAKLRKSRHSRAVDWRRLQALHPYGGIRIEDDVLVTAHGHQNLTRLASGGA